MAYEIPYQAPSNAVRFNTYIAQSETRVPTLEVSKNEWYIARVIDPNSETIDHFATDFLVKVLKVTKGTDGIKIYPKLAMDDGKQEVDESDAIPLGPDGFLLDEGNEHGYLLPIFKKRPKELGLLAAQALVEA